MFFPVAQIPPPHDPEMATETVLLGWPPIVSTTGTALPAGNPAGTWALTW
jgi:hypothetical protein